MSSYNLTVTIAVAFLAVVAVGGILAMIGLTWAAVREDAALRRAERTCDNLQGANLQGADLQGADLRRVDLRDADLRAAHLRDAFMPSTSR